jgi:hypothetical protein
MNICCGFPDILSGVNLYYYIFQECKDDIFPLLNPLIVVKIEAGELNGKEI